MDQIVPIIGILSGIIIPVSVFIWLYYDAKGKRDAIVEIAKHMDDPNKTEKLLTLFDERGGVITVFVGIGLYMLGVTALGALLKGVGLLVGVIGVGTLIAGYLYPNTSQEITHAVERFEGE